MIKSFIHNWWSAFWSQNNALNFEAWGLILILISGVIAVVSYMNANTGKWYKHCEFYVVTAAYIGVLLQAASFALRPL